MKRFALIGAAGYVAPRHMQAIKDTGNTLVAALDKHDSVGILDTYFPEADFFTEFERFDRHLDKLKRQGSGIDYLSVCSPNYLHDAHIRFGLRSGADVICEKPVVLNPWNVDALLETERETGRKVFTILQLRLHPAAVALKQKIAAAGPGRHYQVNMEYITPRGKWYQHSWKGDIEKSGGIVANIGIHFFDLLLWLFGDVKEIGVSSYDTTVVAGRLELEKATVNWKLSIDAGDMPVNLRAEGSKSLRRMIINDEQVDFTDGFTELHKKNYEVILQDRGFGLEDSRSAIQLVYRVRKLIEKK